MSNRRRKANPSTLNPQLSTLLSGCGLKITASASPQTWHQRIFDMFQRSISQTQTGIGLALVRKNMERMGGKVGLESEPNKGSRFWLELRKAE